MVRVNLFNAKKVKDYSNFELNVDVQLDERYHKLK